MVCLLSDKDKKKYIQLASKKLLPSLEKSLSDVQKQSGKGYLNGYLNSRAVQLARDIQSLKDGTYMNVNGYCIKSSVFIDCCGAQIMYGFASRVSQSAKITEEEDALVRLGVNNVLKTGNPLTVCLLNGPQQKKYGKILADFGGECHPHHARGHHGKNIHAWIFIKGKARKSTEKSAFTDEPAAEVEG